MNKKNLLNKWKFELILTTIILLTLTSKSLSLNYPANGNWVIESSGEYIIDQDFELLGNIDNYGNLTIINCQISIYDEIFSLTSFEGSRLILENVTVRGLNTQGSSVKGAMQIRFFGEEFQPHNVSFIDMNTYAIYTTKSLTIDNCTFDSLNGGAIKIPIQEELNNFNITNCIFNDITTSYVIEITQYTQYGYNWNISENIVENSGGFYLKGIKQSEIFSNNFTNAKLHALRISHLSSNITIQSNFFNDTSTNIYVENSNYINISNNQIWNGNLYGIYLVLTNNTSIENSLIQMINGKGIFENNEFGQITWIKNCQFLLESSTSRIQAISIGNSPYYFESPIRATFVDNATLINEKPLRSFYNLSNTLIDLNGLELSKLILMNCTNVSVINAKISSADGIYCSNLVNSSLTNITSNNNFYNGLETDQLYNTTFNNFTMNNNRNHGLVGNIRATYLFYNDHNKYINGTFQNNWNQGLRINNEEHVSIEKINCSNNGDGIYITGIINSTLNQVILSNNQRGIIVSSTQELKITNCTFEKNDQKGAYITDNCYYVNISDNIFIENGEDNLNVDSWGQNFTITQNLFIKSAQLDATNIFVNTFEIEISYNHYSDYSGWDDNSDGIGDNPYLVRGQEIYDYFPLFEDGDNDKLDDLIEGKYGTDPNNNDTDLDGLTDYEELFPLRAFSEILSQYNFILSSFNALNSDTDGDGISDFDEIKIYFSNPNEIDTDQDSFNDYEEINAGSSAIDASDYPGKADTQINENQNLLEEPLPERSISAIPGYPLGSLIVISFSSLLLIFLKKRKRQRKSNRLISVNTLEVEI